VSDNGWSEMCDRALAEIVADMPAPRWARDGWSVRSRRTAPLIELGDLSSDWWSSRTSFRAMRMSARSRPGLPRRRHVSPSPFRVELAATARAAIVRELRRDWDGREQGGALVGRIVGDRVVVEDAGGLGIGVTTPRGDSWFEPPLGRYLDLARACDSDLVGQWHSHRFSPAASSMDRRCWADVRATLGVPAFVGLVVAPRHEFGLRPIVDQAVFSWNNPRVYCYLVTEGGCELVDQT